MKHIITIDVGTMSMRATIYNEVGDSLAESSYEYSAIYLPKGWVEQDPKDWENALYHTLSELSPFIKENEIQIDAISVTSQRASIIPVDDRGNVLHNAITWQDKRSININDNLLKKHQLEDLYQKTGLRSNPYFSMPKMIWLKQEVPLIYARTHKILGVQDYVIFLLTKEFKTDSSQAARTMLMDIKTFQWDDEMIRLSGIDEEKLCEILPPGSIAGGLDSSFAKRVGIEANIPVIMAGGDQQNAALALNVLSSGKAEANTGTGSFIIAHTDEPVFDKNARVLCSASAMPGKWILEASIFNTGSIYRWFRDQFYDGDDADYNYMNQQAEESPIGSNGVIMIPHFEGSAAPFWNPYAKGLFFNLSLGTTRADMTRSILEGVALEITNNMALMEVVAGRIDTISVAGGMTKSDLFNQIQSDIAHKEVVRYADTEASSLGATMSAFVTLGVYDSFEEAFDNIINTEGMVTYHPDHMNHIKYNYVAARKIELYEALNDANVYEKFMDSI